MSLWESFFYSPFGILVVALYGAVVGSFLNVVAHRLPRGDSPMLPRSRCPRCLMPIRPWTNLPVLGWVLLRGQCVDCRGKISARYPLVEATVAVLFAVAFVVFEPRALVVPAWAAVVAAWAVVLALLDLDCRWLPDSLTLPMIPLGLIAQFWVGWARPLEAVLGVVLGAGLALLSSSLWQVWRHEPGFGYGDIKMLAALGAIFGWWGTLFILFFAACVAAVGGLFWMIRGRFMPNGASHAAAYATVPFGAYLSLAATFYMFGWLPSSG